MRRVVSSQFLEKQTIHCAREPFSKAFREMPHVLYYPLKESESLLFSSCVVWKIEASIKFASYCPSVQSLDFVS